MIGSLRKYAQKRGLKIILWLVLFTMAGWSFVPLIRLTKRFGDTGTNIATVGDYDISAMDFRRKYIPIVEYISQIKRAYGPQADFLLMISGLNQNPEKIALDELVQEKTVQAAADSIKTYIGKDYAEQKLNDPMFVNKYLSSIIPPQAFKNGVLNADVLSNILKHMSISDNEFESMLQQAAERNLLTQLLQGTTYISQDMIKEEYIKSYAQKKFAILTIPMAEYLKKAQAEKPKEEDLKKYFEANKEKYKVQEKRNALLWSFGPEAYGISVSDKDIEDYYNRHKNNFVDKAEEIQVRRILVNSDKKAQEIELALKKNPTSFEQIAKKESKAAEKGNALTIKRGDKEPLYDRTAFALDKPNDISPIIKTTEGFEIIKLINKTPAHYKRLESVKGEIKAKLELDKFSKEFTQDAQRVLTQSKDIPNIFGKFITDKKGKESKLEHVLRDAGTKGAKLFGLNNIGDRASYQEGNRGYILELASIEQAFIPELDSVKNSVTKDYYEQKAHDALNLDMQNIRKKLKTEAPKQAIQGTQATLELTDWINPQDKDSMKQLQEKHLPIEEALALSIPKESIEHVDKSNGYIIELTEIEPIDSKKFEEKQNEIELSIYQNELQNIAQAFINNLKAVTKIEINNDMLRKATRRA